MKRQLAESSSPSSSSETPSKRAKYEDAPDPEDGGPGASSADLEGQGAASPRTTTLYYVKRSSEHTDDTSDQGDDDGGYTEGTVGIFANLAAAQRACRREYRALGLDRRHVNGNPNSKWSFEGVADLDPDYAQVVSLESCWIVFVDFECLDGEDGDSDVEEESCLDDPAGEVDYSDGEDVETDVEEAQAIDDAGLYD